MTARKRTRKPQPKPGPWNLRAEIDVIPGQNRGRVVIPILDPRAQTKPEGNRREHHITVWRRGKRQRQLVQEYLSVLKPPTLPASVTLVRHSSGNGMDDDNLSSALKRVRDAVAEWLGCGDGPRDPVSWAYDQAKCSQGEHGVEIRWETRTQ